MKRDKLYRVLDGDDGAATVYGRVMIVLIVASLAPLCFKEPPFLLTAVEWICIAVFIVDYIARWITADYKLGMGAYRLGFGCWVYPRKRHYHLQR